MIKANKAKHKILVEGDSNDIVDEIGNVISSFLMVCAKKNEAMYRHFFNVLLFVLARTAHDIYETYGYNIDPAPDVEHFNPFDLDLKGDKTRG